MEVLTSKPATYGLSKNQPSAFQCNSHSWSKLPRNCPQIIHYLASIQSQKRPNFLRRLIVNIYFGGGPAVGVIVCILLCLTNTPSDIIGKIVFPFQRNAFSSGDRLFWWTSINLVIGLLVKLPSHRTLTSNPHIEQWKEEKRSFGNFYKPLMRGCVCTNIAKVDISLYTIETEMPAQINSFILSQGV